MPSNSNGSLGNQTLSMQLRYPTLVDLYNRFDPGIVVFDRAVTPLWYALGLFGNSLSACVWTNRRVRKNNSSAVYLAALSIWDLIFLLLHSFQELKEVWNLPLEHFVLCTMLPIFLLTAQYLSPLLVLGFTVERWIAICFPFKRDSLCSTRRAYAVTVAMTIGVCLWNLWQAYFKQYDFENQQCHMLPIQGLWSVYTTVTEVLVSGVVPVTALVFNVLVIKELRRITSSSKNMAPAAGSEPNASGADVERRFRSTTVMLLCVSFFVILTSLPAGLMYSLQSLSDFGNDSLTDEEVLQDPTWQRHFAMTRMKKIVDEISISHYSLNFMIYLATGPQYRANAKRLLLMPLAAVGRAAGCDGGGANRQRRQKLRETEAYYLSNSCTDRQRRNCRQEKHNQLAADAAAAAGGGAATAAAGNDSSVLLLSDSRM